MTLELWQIGQFNTIYFFSFSVFRNNVIKYSDNYIEITICSNVYSFQVYLNIEEGFRRDR